MKLYLIFTLVLFMVACTENNENDLRYENIILKKRVDRLEKELDNAMCIPYDSIEKYLSIVTVGEPRSILGEVDEFYTFIQLYDLPAGVKVTYGIDDSSSFLSSEKMMGTLGDSYRYEVENSDVSRVSGVYRFSFPNNSMRSIPWERYRTIK